MSFETAILLYAVRLVTRKRSKMACVLDHIHHLHLHLPQLTEIR